MGIQLRPESSTHYETKSDADERIRADAIEDARDKVIEEARKHYEMFGHTITTSCSICDAVAELNYLTRGVAISRVMDGR